MFKLKAKVKLASLRAAARRQPKQARSNLKIMIASSAFCLLAMTIAAGTAFAADREVIPLPANTQEVEHEIRSIAGSEFDFNRYESNLNSDQVRNFYHRVLEEAGWKQSNYLSALKQDAGTDISASAVKSMEQNLNFEKDGAMLNITFTPERMGRRTGFAIMQGKLDLVGKNVEEVDFIPRLLTKPQHDVAPVYPDAALISLSEGTNFMQAAYSSMDNMERVADFYLRNMPGYGWSLIEDNPEKNINSAASQEDIAEYCPECAKRGIAIPQTNMVMKEFIFSDTRQDKCMIGLFQVYVPAQGQMKEMSFTNIMVDYEKK